MHRVTKNITAILLEAGVVTPEQVERGVLRQRETGRRIGETLVEMGAVTEEDVGWALSRQLGLTFVDIDPETLDTALVHAFHETLLRRSDAVPLLASDAGISIAVADPTDDLALDRLQAAAGAPLAFVIGTPTAIRRALDHVFGARSAGVDLARQADPNEGARIYDVVWERSGDTFLAFHAVQALRRGSRELHFLPRDGQLKVYYREAGSLIEVANEPLHMLESLLSRIEALGGPAPGGALHARGRLHCPMPQGDVLLDASLLTTREGTHVTLALHPEAGAPPTLEALGVDPGDAAELREALAGGVGLVIVAGPPGAGGSTLLASLATFTLAPGARVLALEVDPPATILPGATRIQLSADEARSAWAAIAVAQHADVLLLDDVLTGTALGAVLDGAASQRLVLVSTDWCDTPALLDYLLTVPGARATLARRMLAVLQVRRVQAEPGFLVETLLLSEPLRAALEEGADAPHLLALAAAGGFRTLGQRGVERITAGTLSDAELRRARS
jgi:type II secretory ATPase GspE/PulE/Tfp pilus assembly ATPase PilB-like protein